MSSEEPSMQDALNKPRTPGRDERQQESVSCRWFAHPLVSVTRQMMIIAGGEPELCRRRHAKREGGVYAPPYALRVRKSCPECSVHVLCLCRKV